MNSSGGLFGTAEYILERIAPLGVEPFYQITAVVDNKMRLEINYLVEEAEILLAARAVPTVHFHPEGGQACGYIILGGEGIAAAYDDLCAEVPNYGCHIGGLCLQMETDGHSLTV